MAVQIINYSAFIRLITDSYVLMLAKSQIVDIEAIRDDTVRISIGKGPLQEVFIKLADVTFPSGLADASALRDAISNMLDYANQYEADALVKQQAQLNELVAIKQVLNLWVSKLDLQTAELKLHTAVLNAMNAALTTVKNNTGIIISRQDDEIARLNDQIQYLYQIMQFSGEIHNDLAVSILPYHQNELLHLQGIYNATSELNNYFQNGGTTP
jgi:hypothetical protein